MDLQGLGAASVVVGVLAVCVAALLLSASTAGRPTARLGWGFLAVSSAALVLHSVVPWLPAGTVDSVGLVALASAFPIVRGQRFDPILTVMTAGAGAVVLALVAVIFTFSEFHELALFTVAVMAAVVAVMKLGETVLLFASPLRIPLLARWWDWAFAGLLIAVPASVAVTSLGAPPWLLWVVLAAFGFALSSGIQVINIHLLLRRHRAFALACAEPSSTRRAFSRDFALCVAAPAVAFVALSVSLSSAGTPAVLRGGLLVLALLCLVRSAELQWRLRSTVVGYDSSRRHRMQQAMSTLLVPLAMDDPVYRLLPAFPVER